MDPKFSSKLDLWIKHGFNALFVGDHGIGKTAIVKDAFERNGLKWRYFSAATMDPWVDFVGVPKEKIVDGVSYLDLIRPQDFAEDNVEALFFDEFNRAPDKVRDACMELIQFKSINGKRFENLKVVWAAINPYDENETYHVSELDPAHVDRFHVYYELPNEPSVEFFTTKFGHRMGSRAVDWWKYLPENARRLVSPRRLEYALDMYVAGGDLEDVLDPEVRPKTLKRKVESIDNSTTHADKWLKDADGYLKEVSARTSDINVVDAFGELQDVSMDQAVAFVDSLPSNKLNELAVSSKTIGILVRHAATIQPSNRKVMTALKKNSTDVMMLKRDQMDWLSHSNRDLYVLLQGCENGNEAAWTALVQHVREGIANETLEPMTCCLIFVLAGERGKHKDTFTLINMMYHYIEIYHPQHLVNYVSISPSFVIESWS